MKFVLDDKEIEYNEQTIFRAEVARGPKASYNSYCFKVGQPYQVFAYYKAINLGYGYRKRFVMVEAGKKKVLIKEIS